MNSGSSCLSTSQMLRWVNPCLAHFHDRLVVWSFSTGHSYGLDLGCVSVTSAVKPQAEGNPAAQVGECLLVMS